MVVSLEKPVATDCVADSTFLLLSSSVVRSLEAVITPEESTRMKRLARSGIISFTFSLLHLKKLGQVLSIQKLPRPSDSSLSNLPMPESPNSLMTEAQNLHILARLIIRKTIAKDSKGKDRCPPVLTVQVFCRFAGGRFLNGL